MRNLVAASGVAATIMAGLLGVAAPASAANADADTITVAQCQSEDVKIPGAEAHWTKCKYQYYTRVTGWLKDTIAEGKCVQVVALFTEGGYRESDMACPAGTVKNFDWSDRGDATVTVRLV